MHTVLAAFGDYISEPAGGSAVFSKLLLLLDRLRDELIDLDDAPDLEPALADAMQQTFEVYMLAFHRGSAPASESDATQRCAARVAQSAREAWAKLMRDASPKERCVTIEAWVTLIRHELSQCMEDLQSA